MEVSPIWSAMKRELRKRELQTLDESILDMQSKDRRNFESKRRMTRRIITDHDIEQFDAFMSRIRFAINCNHKALRRACLSKNDSDMQWEYSNILRNKEYFVDDFRSNVTLDELIV